VGHFIIRRLLMMIPVLIGVSMTVFVLMRVIPGDIALLLAGDYATEERLEEIRQELGLNKPIPQQYAEWLWGACRLDFGKSMWSGEPVLSEIARRFPLTLQLALMTTLITIAISIPVGVICAIRQDSTQDYVLRVLAISGLSMPSFWIGIVIIMALVAAFRWVPPLGYVNIWEDPLKNMQILIWPAVAVGFRQAAIQARMSRSCMLEVLRQDYIRTAWAKGLREKTVVIRHALKNAMLPVITIIGVEFAFLFGGLVVTETVFTLPGVGRYLVDAIHHRDYTVIQAIVFIMAVIVSCANLAVDIIYGWLDPRVRYK
jgi:peptide/nickel transport system permease protein